MSFEEITEQFPWARYSRKLKEKISNPRCVGFFTTEECEERGVRLAVGAEGSVADGNVIKIFWMVDKEDGCIIDARFQAYGQSALIGAGEAACEACVGKNYDQATRMTTDLIDRQMRDKQDAQAFPRETFPHLNLALEAIEAAAGQCTDIPLPSAYVAPPVPTGGAPGEGKPYPGWEELPLKKKIAVIEAVLDEDVRPFIAMDAGGVEVLNLLNDRELIITYQGTCTSCYSAVGTTLSYIQQTLRSKVHPEITVVPDLEFDSPYPHG
ncbi:MAG: iron-sulfur cluster assembly scaffold protein [Chlamydiota bacterium]|nr:iron-sulfur cluster assembly scaffold protein [Chlamydiota bacterium]